MADMFACCSGAREKMDEMKQAKNDALAEADEKTGGKASELAEAAEEKATDVAKGALLSAVGFDPEDGFVVKSDPEKVRTIPALCSKTLGGKYGVARVGIKYAMESGDPDMEWTALQCDKDGKYLDHCAYNNVGTKDGSIWHKGDSTDNGTESIDVALAKVNDDCQAIIFCYYAYSSGIKMSDFESVRVTLKAKKPAAIKDFKPGSDEEDEDEPGQEEEGDEDEEDEEEDEEEEDGEEDGGGSDGEGEEGVPSLSSLKSTLKKLNGKIPNPMPVFYMELTEALIPEPEKDGVCVMALYREGDGWKGRTCSSSGTGPTIDDFIKSGGLAELAGQKIFN
eukprot:SAG22_NODE_2682_length_2312_cov_234.180298_1_plen_337_part_00